ncbi:MAG: hypothetical protein DLM54_06845 [Acidimicrobiales bacterium]|nr:MAG: hypothetical protein DLM54_06845 [Acidimicrobiales bacterium]
MTMSPTHPGGASRPVRGAQPAPLAGWTEITSDLLEDHRMALSSQALKRFYDGQVPEWRHALAPHDQIPRRHVVAGALGLLRAPVGQSMILLVASDGEGKSTALRQTAVDLVGERHRVLYRETGANLDIEAVMALPSTTSNWVLASDSADEIADDLEEAVNRVQAAGRRDIQWLLAAGYDDWRARFRQGGRSIEPAWASVLDLWPGVGATARMLALTPQEAATVIGAWGAADCLGALVDTAADARGEALIEAYHGRSGLSATTFLDASLGLRYGPDGLKAHMTGLLPHLGDGDHRFENGRSVKEAFFYAAAADVAGDGGMDLYVLADLLGLDRTHRFQILDRLGQEGLASGSAGVLRIRHHDLARGAIGLTEDAGFGVDLEQIYQDLVRGTGETGTDMKGLAAGGAIMNCGPTLAAKLGELGIPEARAAQVARTAADESARVLPDLLMFALSRALTYRQTDERDEALAILRSALGDVTARGDWGAMGRRYLHDLSVSECDAGHVMESILLVGLSISDVERLGHVSLTEAKLAFDGLGRACADMDRAKMGPTFQRLLSACSHLGQKVTPKWDEPTRLNFHRYAVLADELGATQCWSDQAAVTVVADAVAAALPGVQDADLAELWRRLLPDADRPPFAHLVKTVGLDVR